MCFDLFFGDLHVHVGVTSKTILDSRISGIIKVVS